MALALNRAVFFDAIRRSGLCGKTLTQVHVDGLNGILDAWDKHGPEKPDLRHVAYTMATSWHEARFNAAIREIGRGAGKVYGKPAGPYGQTYYGRSYCQLTWYENYVKFGNLLGIDLARKPDLTLEPETGGAVLVIGSMRGLFRKGRTLPRFFSATNDDPVGARDIINGDTNMRVKAQPDPKLTYGKLIAGHHAKILACLEEAVATPAKKTAPHPVTTNFIPKPEAARPAGIWAQIKAAWSRT